MHLKSEDLSNDFLKEKISDFKYKIKSKLNQNVWFCDILALNFERTVLKDYTELGVHIWTRYQAVLKFSFLDVFADVDFRLFNN